MPFRKSTRSLLRLLLWCIVLSKYLDALARNWTVEGRLWSLSDKGNCVGFSGQFGKYSMSWWLARTKSYNQQLWHGCGHGGGRRQGGVPWPEIKAWWPGDQGGGQDGKDQQYFGPLYSRLVLKYSKLCGFISFGNGAASEKIRVRVISMILLRCLCSDDDEFNFNCGTFCRQRG